MLLQLINGGILNIQSDIKSYSGCETCDYGSEYINEYDIEITTGTIEIRVSQMYDHALSEGSMMEIILPNTDVIKTMTEIEFYEWIKEKVQEKIKEETYDFYDKDIKIDFIEKS
jgi:hypothetical protein